MLRATSKPFSLMLRIPNWAAGAEVRSISLHSGSAPSAGAVMANRLSEDKRSSVLVLEFGGTDWGPFIQMPAALSYPMNMRRYDWGYRSEPEPHLGGRRLACPRQASRPYRALPAIQPQR